MSDLTASPKPRAGYAVVGIDGRVSLQQFEKSTGAHTVPVVVIPRQDFDADQARLAKLIDLEQFIERIRNAGSGSTVNGYPEATSGYSNALESGQFSLTVLKTPCGRFKSRVYIIHRDIWDGHRSVVESLTIERDGLRLQVEEQAGKIAALEARLNQPQTQAS
ncbi:MAG: hypothetical protein LBV12_08820 [Puniceicoccales bacterium]|nr:hypothetical protein [Puniceicoccales bacterium]